MTQGQATAIIFLLAAILFVLLVGNSVVKLLWLLTCAAQFVKYNTRAKKWLPVDAPDKVAQILLANEGKWRLPILTGVTNAPFVRTDGSVCETPGYDPESGLL